MTPGPQKSAERPGAAALGRGLRAWTRMHGVVSLELEGAFASMGLDGALLFAAEVASLARR